jgi:hypothetical protein
MPCRSTVIVILLIGWFSAANSRADDTDASADGIRGAISKTIPLLQQGMKGSADERKCFTCHNQAVPVFALAEARRRGFAIDEENFTRQLDHTAAHLRRGRKEYLNGKGQGGRVLTAGYALWTLEAGGRPSDENTSAVTQFLLDYQSDTDHWRHPGNRPPSSGSNFTATYLALSGLIDFGTEEQQSGITSRIDEVASWILSEQPRDTEDRVFQLLSLPYIDVDADAIEDATEKLIDTQRDDGSWAQLADMPSDAYATGTALVALLDAGNLASDHDSVRRGVEYLLSTQLDDGSWHVGTRAKPIQKYFESGFPHGKDQFISMAASSWATLALLLTLEESQ